MKRRIGFIAVVAVLGLSLACSVRQGSSGTTGVEGPTGPVGATGAVGPAGLPGSLQPLTQDAQAKPLGHAGARGHIVDGAGHVWGLYLGDSWPVAIGTTYFLDADCAGSAYIGVPDDPTRALILGTAMVPPRRPFQAGGTADLRVRPDTLTSHHLTLRSYLVVQQSCQNVAAGIDGAFISLDDTVASPPVVPGETSVPPYHLTAAP